MLLFCDGMPRSASTWTYNVAFALLKTAFPDAQIRRTHDENSQAALRTLGDGVDWAIVKCHALDDNARSLLRVGNARGIYTHRDLYDAIASFLVMFRFPFDHCLHAISESLGVYDFHCEAGDFLCLDYESIVNRPIAVIEAIAEFLNLSVPPSAIELVQEAHSLAAIKELSTRPTLLGEDRIERSSASRWDRETQWHVRHVRNGGIGYGRRYLLPQQIEQIDNLIRNRRGPSRDLLRCAYGLV